MQTPKNIEVQTFTPTYDSIEDRIRISINYQDLVHRLDIMLTRSFCLQLIPTLEEFFYKYYPPENNNIVSHSNNVVKSNSVNQNRSKTNVDDLSLYKLNEELLITLNLQYNKQTASSKIEFITKEKSSAILIANHTIFENIIHALKESIPNISWGISKHF